MENEEIIMLLKEIRDLQKVQIANQQEAFKTQIERSQKVLKRGALFLFLFLIVNWAIAYLPALFNHQ